MHINIASARPENWASSTTQGMVGVLHTHSQITWLDLPTFYSTTGMWRSSNIPVHTDHQHCFHRSAS
jgi:hypothetical protein